jgi:transposase-like protein
VLGVDVGDSENDVFWRKFLSDLTDRGLGGVKLVIAGAYAGLVKRSVAVSRVRPGDAAASTRCATSSQPRPTASGR